MIIDTSAPIGEDVFVNECMAAKSVSKPTKNVSRRDLLREISKEKKYVRYSGSLISPMDGCVFAMDYILTVALMVADNKHNTPAGWDAIYDMRKAMAALRDM